MLNIDETVRKLDIPFEALDKIIDRATYNDMLSDFYTQYAEESGEIKYLNVAQNVKYCYSNIIADRYSKRKIYDIKFINYCHNRFCANCQKLIQATRLTRIAPILSATMAEHDLYHIVFTVPNVTATELSGAIDVIFEAFSNMIKYFKCKTKICGIDFSFLEYCAALRSLEITYNERKGDYHPHLHCIFALKKDLIFNKIHKNVYSYDTKGGKREFKRYFSDFELLLQKLWRQIYDGLTERNAKRIAAICNKTGILAAIENSAMNEENIRRGYAAFGNVADVFKKAQQINAKRITKQKIDELGKNDGYSVIMDYVSDGNYYEVFKYAFKLFDEDERILGYEQFKTLLKALEGRKQIQCYGAWYATKLNDDIDELVKDELTELLVQLLKQEEEAVKVGNLTVQELYEKKKRGYAVITASKIQRLLQTDFSPEELDSFLSDTAPLLEYVIRELHDKEAEKSRKLNIDLNAPDKETYERYNRKRKYNEIVSELCKFFELSFKKLSIDMQLQRDYVNGTISEADLRRGLYARIQILQEPLFNDSACSDDYTLKFNIDLEDTQRKAREFAGQYSALAHELQNSRKRGG